MQLVPLHRGWPLDAEARSAPHDTRGIGCRVPSLVGTYQRKPAAQNARDASGDAYAQSRRFVGFSGVARRETFAQGGAVHVECS
jgi:hypothetical protein